MTRRALDLLMAGILGVISAPLLAAAAVGIKLSDPGPVFYRAVRAGRGGQPFRIVKLRTMRQNTSAQSQITSSEDRRVFPFGSLLRTAKVDELLQLWNVARGQMSIVGPRPEAIDIVTDHYRPEHHRTLDVRPGLASPGSIYNYTGGEDLIGDTDPERDYVEKLLPIKLGLELVYVERASVAYDLRIVARTAKTVIQILMGRTDFDDPPEMSEAMDRHLYPIDFDSTMSSTAATTSSTSPSVIDG